MIRIFSFPHRLATRLLALFAVSWLAACDGVAVPGLPSGGTSIDASRPVKVALLVPGGSQNSGDNLLARNLEDAARLAVADLAGAQIDLSVYNTAGDPAQAAAMAQQAANDGAKIILGPLHREAAVAASTTVARQGISVLSFSNTSTIAGGNLFLLGQLYETTARRLVGYATRQGITRYYIVTAEGPAGALGQQAIASAVAASGAQVVGSHAYPLSQQSIIDATTVIAAQARAAGAQAIITTAQPGAELAILGTILPEQGIRAPEVRYMGLTRWNAAPEMLEVPGLEGGYFAMPDMGRQSGFDARFTAAYGGAPHPLAGLAYDGIAAVGALIATGRSDALSPDSLTRSAGFQGTSGIFRFLRNGQNQRGLAIATIEDGAVKILEPAPSSFGNGIN